MELFSAWVDEAKKAGFPLAGAVDIDLALHDPEGRFFSHVERYDSWIQKGHAGKMEYLVRGRDRRANPRLVFPPAQSVFCVALPYPAQPGGAPNPAEGPRYARYLQGPDYHLELTERLDRALKSLQGQWNLTHPSTPLEWKICVDTSAVLERTWAALAGLGWIGKNSLLIHPQHGSYFFLGTALVNLTTHQAPRPLPNFCGQCTRCLRGCPTQALSISEGLNSNRCISYWTLEKRGDLEISPSDQAKIGPWVAGCDICQEVCPFNTKPSKNGTPSDPHATRLRHWVSLLQETQEEYRSRVKNSALNRIKPPQFSRNLAIALLNTLREEGLMLCTSMQSLIPLIETKILSETDSPARAAWEECLEFVQKSLGASLPDRARRDLADTSRQIESRKPPRENPLRFLSSL